MIIIIDEDSNAVQPLMDQLLLENHQVELFATPISAFEHLDSHPPECIVCELNMPNMDGLEFHQHYNRRFPNRKTPFILYTTRKDRFTRIRAINMGVEDYFLKPEDPALMVARVNTAIKRARVSGIREFYGDLQKFSFVNIITFCERKRFSGDLVLWIGEGMEVLSFNSGRLVEDGAVDLDRTLEQAMAAREGMFLLRTSPFDFSEIRAASVEKAIGGDWYQEQRLGELSFKMVRGNLFQIQTDYYGKPHNQLLTRVFCQGRKVFQIRTEVPQGKKLEGVAKLLKYQHEKVEGKVKGDFDATPLAASSSEEEGGEFFSLFQRGMTLFKAGDLSGARELWERARKLNPEDPLLKMNLRILTNRLKRETP